MTGLAAGAQQLSSADDAFSNPQGRRSPDRRRDPHRYGDGPGWLAACTLSSDSIIADTKSNSSAAGVHALAQRRARRQQSNVQDLLEERVATVRFDGVEIALALPQQPKIRAQDVAIGHPALNRQRRIDSLEYRPYRLQQMPPPNSTPPPA